MEKQLFRFLGAGCLALSLCGCVVNKMVDTDPVATTIVTYPETKARVYVNGEFRGNAPVRIRIPQDSQRKLLEDVTIEIRPVVPGPYPQVRHLVAKGREVPVPVRVMIDVRSPDPALIAKSE